MIFSIANDFSRFPAGRTKADGPYSGEALREILVALLQQGPVTVDLDGTMGYASNFLEEAFRGLGASPNEFGVKTTEDASLALEIMGYAGPPATRP